MPNIYIPNLAPNANPLTALFVELIERSGPIDLRIYRMRDAWLFHSITGACQVEVCLLIHLGGEHRGGANAPLWHRIRQHRWYVTDSDSTITDHAVVKFGIMDHNVEFHAANLISVVPMLGVDAEQKLRDSIDVQMGLPKKTYPALVSKEEVQRLSVTFAVAVEMSPNLRKPEANPTKVIAVDQTETIPLEINLMTPQWPVQSAEGNTDV